MIYKKTNRFKLWLSFFKNKFDDKLDYFYWQQYGYNYGFSQDLNNRKSTTVTFTADFSFEKKFDTGLKIDISSIYRGFNNIGYENYQYLNDNIISIESLSGNVWGYNFKLTHEKNKIKHTLEFNNMGTLSKNIIFNKLTKKKPLSTVNYNIRYKLSPSFTLWGNYAYESISYWPNYEYANNETYMNLYNSTLRYDNNIDNKNIIDIGFKKSLYKEKIITDFFIRNLLNIKYYYHPIGAAFNTALFIKIKFAL